MEGDLGEALSRTGSGKDSGIESVPGAVFRGNLLAGSGLSRRPKDCERTKPRTLSIISDNGIQEKLKIQEMEFARRKDKAMEKEYAQSMESSCGCWIGWWRF